MIQTSADIQTKPDEPAEGLEWPDYLDQQAASAYLWRACGVKMAPKSLQKRRVVGLGAPGGSPPFRKILGRIIYERAALKAWGDAQRSPEVRSTSELPGWGNT